MRTRNIVTAVIAAAAALLATVAGCSTTGSTNWYAAGRAYSHAEGRFNKATLMVPSYSDVAPAFRKLCTSALSTWPEAVKGSYGGYANPLANLPLTAPGSGVASTAGQKWISGCIAGNFQTVPLGPAAQPPAPAQAPSAAPAQASPAQASPPAAPNPEVILAVEGEVVNIVQNDEEGLTDNRAGLRTLRSDLRKLGSSAARLRASLHTHTGCARQKYSPASFATASSRDGRFSSPGYGARTALPGALPQDASFAGNQETLPPVPGSKAILRRRAGAPPQADITSLFRGE